MAIMEKAQNLADAIVNSEEYSNLRDAEAEVSKDESAQQLLQQYQAEQRKLQMAQMNGQEVNEDMKNDLQALQAKMQENTKVKELMDAQQKFNKVMETVNKVISGALSPEEENDAEGCGGGCC
ncbi:hypothetical protein Halha_0963 [Halobacteroides halobius DSM 5150]|uniref:Uncharacterized protein n=1 Tax=Halobacteroides halobius (strain ATCC 35273 / DSM 5150 / MD-1) TaxID=748449 RepID=L0K994_HALHC|nr:YlbF family regulator [Halobacteroides halobius]AGB40924.1 hypothetical protein Halha_0963 [Halobacteroides halobius DSM 5150]